MAIVYLQVPYASKDAAKSLGAKWDAEQRSWYAPAGAELILFAEWMTAAAWLANGRQKSKGQQAARATGRRQDASGGRITIGVNYVEAVGATGLPWD